MGYIDSVRSEGCIGFVLMRACLFFYYLSLSTMNTCTRDRIGYTDFYHTYQNYTRVLGRQIHFFDYVFGNYLAGGKLSKKKCTSKIIFGTSEKQPKSSHTTYFVLCNYCDKLLPEKHWIFYRYYAYIRVSFNNPIDFRLFKFFYTNFYSRNFDELWNFNTGTSSITFWTWRFSCICNIV